MKNTLAEVSLQLTTLFRKILRLVCFPVNIGKFVRKTFS